MKLLFERSVEGRRCSLLPENKVPFSGLSSAMKREIPLRLPEMAEVDISRHYTALAKQVYGVNSGFYPLGSCTMKYNPAVNEELSSLAGFRGIHPLQPEHTVQGSLEVLDTLAAHLSELVGYLESLARVTVALAEGSRFVVEQDPGADPRLTIKKAK